MNRKLFAIFIVFGVLSQGFIRSSEYDKVIEAEIKNDRFYQIIYRIAKTEPIQTILEIGASNGEGSTAALVKGILENPKRPMLFCIEMSKPRFDVLKKRYESYSQVVCYNVSSVPVEAFPPKEEIAQFYPHLMNWYLDNVEYVKKAGVSERGIELIKSQEGIDLFDMVLIDGSEFTGEAELNLTYGAKWILLDDIAVYKNQENYLRLTLDPCYELVEEDVSLRNGYAVFRRI